jgi:hypothetical protein
VRILIVIASLSICFITSYAQEELLIAPFFIVDEDTIFTSNIPEIEIFAFKNKQDRHKYYILKRRVLKVYPYALLAKEKLNNIEQGLDTISKRRNKKRYTKEMTKWIREEYTERLKNLTMSEGRILVKLIYRETKITSYEIVKVYRGIFNAFFWQGMATLWNNNLKTGYDPINIEEDMLIEHILIQAKSEGKFE